MKVFFDIITNHTADVIGYAEGRPDGVRLQGRRRRTRTPPGEPFDDRDYAGTTPSPSSTPRRRSPTCRCSTPARRTSRSPAWLNDLTMYHNRGNTTFIGEDSQYGDFFGLDDLFTERPEVVDGMVDIYADLGRGLRHRRLPDRHHEARQRRVLAGVRPAPCRPSPTADGNPDFFMFGEVALDGSDAAAKSFTSHYTTHDRMQAILDFPFQDAARGFASRGPRQPAARAVLRERRLVHRPRLERLLAADLPRQPRHGPDRATSSRSTTRAPTTPSCSPATGWPTSSCTSRAATRSSTTATSRASPATAATSSPGRRCSRARSPEYQGDDQIGTDRTGADDNFVTDPRSTRRSATLAALTDEHPALRDGAQQVRYASSGAGRRSPSRGSTASSQKEYVVALNNSESTASAQVPTYIRKGALPQGVRRRARPA